MTKPTLKELTKIVRETLANDVCSAQSLDVAQDRGRVERQIMKAIAPFVI